MKKLKISTKNYKMDYIHLKYVEVNQPIGKLYVASIKCKDLLEIATNDIRRIERDEANNIDTYFGIQRKPSPNRLKEIADYVTYVDATFPSNIVIAINSVESFEDQEDIDNVKIVNGELLLRRNPKIAQILDGQHRLLGLQLAIEENALFSESIKENFELAVTIYVDMDIENQSMVFATINKAQTKVNKSLVYDLYDLANSRSPYRTAHNIVRVLNDNEKSSLKDKIKMLGVAEDSEQETIAQATLVDCLVEYISRKPLKDRDILKRGEEIKLENDKKLFFRKWFKEKNDLLIARTLLNYFNAISKKWPTAWNPQSILIKSTGIIGFMKFLQNIVGDNELKEEISEERFTQILNSLDINPESFTNDNYPSGGIGQNKLKKELIEKSGLK